LSQLISRDNDHALLIKTLKETPQQMNAEYRRWETLKLVQVNGKSTTEVKAYMVQKYESKLKDNVKVALEEIEALIDELRKFVMGAQVLLEEL
jgi:hypothetical protein